MATTTTVLRLADIEARCAVNRRTLYYWIERGIFPRPIRLGPRTVGWLDRDIDAWIEEKARASHDVANAKGVPAGSPHD
jgi:prophage regulatory protein